MKELLTIVIPSYKSKPKIIEHVKTISKKIQIIIVENSEDKILKKFLEKKYKNVKVFLRKNIGFGRAINYGGKFVKTKYFFVMNPDTKIYNDTLKNLINTANIIKKFGAISPEHISKKKRKLPYNKIEERKTLTGGAMLFETKTFKKIKGFDENIFLYYEDNDFFTRCRMNNLKLYVINNSFHYHKKKNSSSATFKNFDEKNYAKLIAGWHGQWSKFYFLKKYHGYAHSFLKCAPRLIMMLFQLILNLAINTKKAKYIYFKIEGLFSSMIGLAAFKRSKYDH